ncbi:MAG: hypothetical protein J6V91_00270 [Kiritimatiellae bacterium]|jgi:hypothetical protein|nr:hypothetical protein [Kiritimatiellia bacterium]
MEEQQPVNILCLKWGTRYPASFTNILYASVKRHLHRPFRFVCVTDDPTGLAEGIDARPFPENPRPDLMDKWPNIFIKLCVFKDGFCDLQGPTLFFDVDVVIQEDIDCFFDYMPGKNCIIHNWVERRKQLLRGRPNIGNSSCFRFEAGKSNYIYEKFLEETADAIDRSKFPTEQAFMTYAMKEVYWWPEEWVKSFKRTCVPIFPFNFLITPPKPKTCVLVFHGNPDPDAAVAGFKGKKLHHSVRPCKWILEDWHE